jgi:hypothetical protein
MTPEREVVQLEMHARGGVPGVDESPDNPLARATRRLLEDGQRFVSFMPTTLAPAEPGAALRWFGAFVLTEAGRVLFFPGLDQPYDRIAGGLGDGRGRFDRALQVDHATLEPDRRSWHLTGARNKRQGGGRTQEVGAGRTLWFCVTAAGFSEFRQARAATIARAECIGNRAEMEGRASSFFASVTNGKPARVELRAKPAGECALHFAVALGSPGAPAYDGDGMPFPHGAPGIERLSVPPGTIAQHSTALLAQDIEVQILAVWLPGKAPPGVLTFTYAWP